MAMETMVFEAGYNRRDEYPLTTMTTTTTTKTTTRTTANKMPGTAPGNVAVCELAPRSGVSAGDGSGWWEEGVEREYGSTKVHGLGSSQEIGSQRSFDNGQQRIYGNRDRNNQLSSLIAHAERNKEALQERNQRWQKSKQDSKQRYGWS
ncbi:uncharacterized protein Ecym_3156 [Eremothecium cymbalariae DBVPG|uniref:Uncharacterized protein n=1 Tax=Eremothecium cymbalariae (strain CBS 270.75 / DBVPG 7215 / KCTC 17166 / NRRL Y-17582) TaxID=931890 RepID=G8JR90_ERECY|nr:Hypothetical protein Ecym_3156 [Eremothecium cymbalariae DBVPG\